MKKIITFLSLVFTISFGLAQTNPIDFEVGGNGAGWTWTVFENGTNPALEIIANPVSGGGNTSATVAKFTALQTGQPWAGCETTDIGSFTFDANNSVVKLWVYKDVISEVKVKFEGSSPAIESTGIQNSVTGQWEELTFDFSNVIGSSYNKLVIFPDFVARTQDNIIYFDNMTFNAGTPPAEPVVAAPVPTHDQTDVISVYSDTYNDITGTNFNPGWGQSTVVSFQDIGGNEMMKYANFNYQGTQLDGNQDMSAMEFMHVDIWTADATVVKVTPISFTTGEFLVELTPLNQGSWQSYDIPVGDFTGVSMADIHQLKFDGQSGVTPSNIFVDNIFFWKNPTAAGSDATLSDLQVDGTTVNGFSTNTLNYDIELPHGTTIVPTVTATPNDPNASHVVNPAGGLPGTTSVVVTAQDGNTQLTYNVNFSLEDAVPTTAAPVPAHDEVNDNVFSVYSDTYTNLTNTNFNPNWGQSTQVTIDHPVGGNNTLLYENLNYQGTNLGSTDGLPQDFSAHDFLHIDFWTPDATTLDFYLISQTTGEQAYNLPVQTEQWVSVDIPLTHYSGLGLDLSDIFQFKVAGADGTVSVYFDNWYFYSAATPTEPTIAAPIPTHDPVDVISIYSDAYTDIAGTDFMPGWGQTTVVTFEDIGGNEMMKYADFNYQGTQLSANQDMSAMEFMHVDIWTADATVVKVTPISFTTGEFLVELTPLNQGSWQSYDIPVGDFTGVSMADIHQLKFDGQAGVTPSTVYLDNIFFWKNPTAAGSDATLSDLQLDGTTVNGFSANTLNYEVELAEGTTIVPTVTATPNDPNASHVVNPAGGLPGTTSVVVTAQDGNTQLTYNVNFTIADLIPTVGAPVPTHDEVDDNVFSIYSDAYTNLVNTNFNPNWGQSTQVTVDEPAGGNNSLLYENLNYQGTNLGSADGLPQDLSGHDYIHIDFWTPNATALNFFLISQTSGEIPYALTVTTEQWVSVDIPLTHFSGQGLDLSDIFQFKVDGGDGTTTVYFDNWYFWTATASTDATLSDLQVDGTTVVGFDPGMLNYEVELAEGTTIIPTVTATTNNVNASYVVNDATVLPGTTTVVVTAEDGMTNLTYSVNFVFPDPSPAEAAPVPTHEDQYVISVYSDTYTDLAGTNFNPGWGQTTIVSFEDIGGNEMMKYDNFNYQGTQFAGNQDLSIMEFMHVDIWTPDATSIQVTPISATTGEFLVELTPLNQGSWNSYDIPVGDFTGVSMADIHQLKFDGQAGVTPSIVYVDNIFFWKNPPAAGTDATLSDLQVDGTTVDGFSPSILSYDIELPYGTSTVPTVTATTTDLNATYIINNATALPGTTSVVVTAEDDITMLTYNVNFSLEDAVPTEGAPTPVHDETLHSVFSIYSGSYTNLENTNFNPDWGQSTQVMVDEPIGGNNTLVYTDFNYQGTNLGSEGGSPQDISGHDFIHLDFWTPDASVLNFFLISQGSGEVSYSLPVSTEEWIGVNIPMSHFSDQGLDLTDIYQFKVDGGDGSVTVYFDNWYFWNVIDGGDATLSDLQVDGETVAGFNPNVFSYDVELPEGTTEVPTVTATTSDADATYEIIDATELPGTTEVVVTAEDGTTTLTYYVNFLLPDETPAEAAPTPAHLEENVISMFSDVYTSVDVDTWLTDWSVAVLEEVEIEGNPTKKYSDLDYAGIETVSNPIDLESTGMVYLHIDFWTANSTAFRIKLVDFGGDGFGGGNDTEAELELTPALSEWNSMDVPLEDFAGMNMSDINQFIISSNPSGESIVFIDNVFYWKDPVGVSNASTEELNIYPNPTRDFWYINSEEVVHEIQVFDLSGRVVISDQPEKSGIIRIDAAQLNRGFYLIRINGSIMQEFKLIRE